MASLIPGYEYDIFISYRQKDNKYDGWVTDFVDNLKRELEAAFKEDISVYFDINPHDGLLETHDVDASLKEKLKCLVFIPILSRTYCDPNSFAWEHEFKAFIENASKDQFGLKVKLPDGNVANRVLPVRIYALENADIKLCESLLGGVLRGVEFIYKEPGVNRPLSSKEDNPNNNLNKTFYRNQINKVANAVKGIIQGLQTGTTTAERNNLQTSADVFKEEKIGKPDRSAGLKKVWLRSALSVLAVLIIAGLLFYPKIFKRNTLENLRSSDGKFSVAVMPFQNLSNDSTWNIWQEGIQDMLTNSFSNNEELTVRQAESIKEFLHSKGITNYASVTPSVAGSVAQKLVADVFVSGSIIQAGPSIRLYAQLTNSKTETVYKSFQIDGNAENITSIVDSLSEMVMNTLLISNLGKDLSNDYKHFVSTNSPIAYKYYIMGTNAYAKREWSRAISMFSASTSIDSNFTYAGLMLSLSYVQLCVKYKGGGQELFNRAKESCRKVYKNWEQMPFKERIFTNYVNTICLASPNEEIYYLNQLLEIDKEWPVPYFNLGDAYRRLQKYDKAIPGFEKAMEIYNSWGSKPNLPDLYNWLGEAYHKSGQYKKERNFYKKALKDFPDDHRLIGRQAILSFTEKDTVAANRYVKKLVSVSKDDGAGDALIAYRLGWIYSEAGVLDKAEEYYRQAVTLKAVSREFQLHSLARFLIDNNLNISEGLEIVEKLLIINPLNWYVLDTRGWGLYKQGKYKEALEVLQSAWENRTYYDHDLNTHLQVVKNAAAGLN